MKLEAYESLGDRVKMINEGMNNLQEFLDDERKKEKEEKRQIQEMNDKIELEAEELRLMLEAD